MIPRFNTDTDLRPIHTKHDNYKDNDIRVHTSEQYRLFILSARTSVVGLQQTIILIID